MGFLSWLRRVFVLPSPPRARYVGDGICPYCGAVLATSQARQCFECGVDWHDSQNVKQRGGRGKSSRGAILQQPATADTSTVEKTPRQDVTLTNLDLGQFAPLTTGEVRRQAVELGPLWTSRWFGRTDLIPPVSDPRTALIDRAMVGQGLITAEELQEIHQVGAEMDRVRPDLALAAEQADAAVARSREEREELKRRKKEQAEERRRLRAEAIAQRKATDIVFLGRGVSGRLHDRRADVEQLKSRQLPVLASPADLASALEIDIPRLRWLAFHNQAAQRVHYIAFDVPKRSGGVRRLHAPHRQLADCQRWILENILQPLDVHEAAHGFVAGRSIKTGAVRHVGRAVVVNLDLQDFFPTITLPRVRGFFQKLGYSPAVATILALLCTEAPRQVVEYAGRKFHVAVGPRGLPQGACTSPALSNQIARRLDSRLAGLANKLGWRYTRYADDLAFSADKLSGELTGYLLARVRHIAAEEGFAVNEKKTRVQRTSTAQVVTGLVVNHHPSVGRKTLRRMRAILHRAQQEGLAAQNREDHPNFAAWVEGMIAYIQMVQPEQGKKLRDALAALND